VPISNRDAARAIFAAGSLLESQGANPYRVRAYRRAAVGMLMLSEHAGQYTDEQGELVLPWLGKRLRRKLGELVRTGRMQFYDDIIAELPKPWRELLSVPGIGPKRAERLIQEGGIKSVRGLSRAAKRHRLRALPGFGPTLERQLADAADDILGKAA